MWSLDGKEELLDDMTINLNEDEDDDESNTEDKKRRKSARLDWVFWGISSPYSYREQVRKAYTLGTNLANQMIKNGAKPILDRAKAENNAGIINQAPTIRSNSNGVKANSNGLNHIEAK